MRGASIQGAISATTGISMAAAVAVVADLRGQSILISSALASLTGAPLLLHIMRVCRVEVSLQEAGGLAMFFESCFECSSGGGGFRQW